MSSIAFHFGQSVQTSYTTRIMRKFSSTHFLCSLFVKPITNGYVTVADKAFWRGEWFVEA